MFENRRIDGYAYATEYIASWLRAGGRLQKIDDYDNFHNWLLSMNLSERDVDCIMQIATNGKLELECNAELFLRGISK